MDTFHPFKPFFQKHSFSSQLALIFKTQSTKLEVFDNILFNFRISNTLQLHIFLILKFLRMATSTSKNLQDVLHISSTDLKPNIDGFLIQQVKQYQPSH